MAYDLKSEEEVKEYVENLGIEYRFGCFQEKKPEVCHLLGDYLESIKKDFEKAGRIYRNTCDDYKYAKSCYKYGNYCLLGKGNHPKDAELSFNYYKKGCDLGDFNSCLNSGVMNFASGSLSRRVKDYTLGLAHLNKCCNGKNSYCCYYISGLYISGAMEANIRKDMSKAFEFSMKACELGNMNACANLSQMYKKGDGVEKNDKLAEKYKKIALELQAEMQENRRTLEFQQGLKSVPD